MDISREYTAFEHLSVILVPGNSRKHMDLLELCTDGDLSVYHMGVGSTTETPIPPDNEDEGEW